MEMSAAKILIIHENLRMDRIEVAHPVTNEITVHHVVPGEEDKKKIYTDAETGTLRYKKWQWPRCECVEPIFPPCSRHHIAGIEMKEVSRVPLVEWFADNYKNTGSTLEFVTDKSQEGNQFCKGFGGVGAILQWKVDFQAMEHVEIDKEDDEENLDVDDFDFDEYDAATGVYSVLS